MNGFYAELAIKGRLSGNVLTFDDQNTIMTSSTYGVCRKSVTLNHNNGTLQGNWSSIDYPCGGGQVSLSR